MAVTTYIVDKDGNQIDASTATVPTNRDFRNAWTLSGSVITEDLSKAKEIFADKIREARAPLLAALDRLLQTSRLCVMHLPLVRTRLASMLLKPHGPPAVGITHILKGVVNGIKCNNR